MRSKSFMQIVLTVAWLIAFGASAASASTDFGTTETGVSVDRYIYFQWSSSTPGDITHFTVPNGYSVIDYYPQWYHGQISFGETYYVRVRLNASTPGTYNGTLYVWHTGGNGHFDYLTGTVVEPCNTSPTVSITGPTNGSTKSPNVAGNVILSANASDSAGIDKVEFYVDGAKVATDYSSSYAYAWPAKTGSHQVYAKAYNSCGNSTVSASVTYTVNCGNPAVTLTKPVHGSTVSPNIAGNVILEATASHSTGISKVNFFIDGNLVRRDTNPPYAYAWPASPGTYLARARTFSNCGGAGVSSNAATFTVN